MFRTAKLLMIIAGTWLAMLGSGANAASVLKFANTQAINWNGRVVDSGPLMAFYKRQFFKGIWTGNMGLSPRGQELAKVLANAPADGLDPRDYLSGLPGNYAQLSGDHLSALELYLSESAHKFARDLHGGRTTPSITEPDIVIARKKLDLVALLGSLDKNGVAKVMERLRPQHSQYRYLRELLQRTSDPAMQRKIVTNMERWRWLPRDLGDRHVFVNTAAFLMYTREKGKTVDRRRVIVGEAYHKTPMFSDNIQMSEFNPTWTITPSIAGNEVLPKLRQDPSYLQKKGYVLYTSWEADAPAMNARAIDWSSVSARKFPYRIVQPAGPDNVLGVVKFLFPNRFNVYLHDTSSRQLFDKNDRALSHGCIRVDKPVEWAALLHGLDGTLSAQQINGLIQSGKTLQAKLRKPIPVHLGYFTLWVGDDGKVSNFDDIYGRDKLIENIILGRV
ncbi:MAG: L,D-transpeptidase family protein [Rhizobiaceae bacterium]